MPIAGSELVRWNIRLRPSVSLSRNEPSTPINPSVVKVSIRRNDYTLIGGEWQPLTISGGCDHRADGKTMGDIAINGIQRAFGASTWLAIRATTCRTEMGDFRFLKLFGCNLLRHRADIVKKKMV